MALTITHEQGSGTARAELDGRPAGSLHYSTARNSDSPVWTVSSTVVDRRFGGRGVGSALVAQVAADASAAGATIVPVCWFVDGWLQRHPDYAHLLADDLH